MQKIQDIIRYAINSLYQVESRPEISPAPKKELGEYCVNIFPIVKQVGKAPNIISEEVAKELAKQSEIFKWTSATGGYVNFFLTDTVWWEIFWSLDIGAKEKNSETIVVDYIGANVGKPLHIGHICTPSIWQTLCNVYRHLGYEAIGDSHFGDWGGIFGKLIYAWREEMLMQWSDVNLKLELEKRWISFLLELYQWYHLPIRPVINDPEIWLNLVETELKIDKGIEDTREQWARLEFQYLSWIGIDLSIPEERRHHEENVELWKKFTAISITETGKKLDLLGVHATYNIGESFYEWLHLPRPNDEKYPDLKSNMKDIVAELIEKWVATPNDDGSVGVVFPEDMKIPSCILQKKDGTGLYLTSDLAAIKYRLTNVWNPSKIIYSVDVRQQLHLKQAFTIAKMAWPELTKDVEFSHAWNGFIKLKEGAMSTRHGTVIFLEDLITEGNTRTARILEEKWRTWDKSLDGKDIQAITVGAIKYSYLAQDREKDVTFDWDKALSFEGNSWPYIQYAYVRARKIIGDTGPKSPETVENLSSYDKEVIQILARFGEVVDTVAKTYKPHHLALYAYDLAVCFNSFYVHTPKILEETDANLRAFRLSLVKKVADTLERAFGLLAIEMPSEM